MLLKTCGAFFTKSCWFANGSQVKSQRSVYQSFPSWVTPQTYSRDRLSIDRYAQSTLTKDPGKPADCGWFRSSNASQSGPLPLVCRMRCSPCVVFTTAQTSRKP